MFSDSMASAIAKRASSSSTSSSSSSSSSSQSSLVLLPPPPLPASSSSLSSSSSSSASSLSSSASSSSSSSSSSSPPLFMCCMSLPGPLQPLSLPSPDPPSPSYPSSSSSPSPSSSSSSSPSQPPAASLSEIARIPLQRNHVAELLLFRRRKKLITNSPLSLPPQQKQQKIGETQKHAQEQQSKKKTKKKKKERDQECQDSSVIRHRHEHVEDQSSRFKRSSVLTGNRSNGNGYGKANRANGSDVSSIVAEDRKSWELLKSGEVSNLIKQGFMERTQRRLSPGRVSPLQTTNQMQDTIAASTEKSMSPLHGHNGTIAPTPSSLLMNMTNRKTVPELKPSRSPPPSIFSSSCSSSCSEYNQANPKPANTTSTLFDMMTRDAEKTVRSNNKHRPPTAPYLPSSLASYSSASLPSGCILDTRSRSAFAKKKSATEAEAEADASAAMASSTTYLKGNASNNNSTNKQNRFSSVIFNDPSCSDVKLILKASDGGGTPKEACLHLHRRILADKSKFFESRLNNSNSRNITNSTTISPSLDTQQSKLSWPQCSNIKQATTPATNTVKQNLSAVSVQQIELKDCEDLEAYQETLSLFYCGHDDQIQARLLKHSLPRVLAILKVASQLSFEACIMSCLEYLEAAPWAEDEEEKIRSLLGELNLGSEAFTVADVLKRLNLIHPDDGDGTIVSSLDSSNSNTVSSEETLVCLLQTVIRGKDNKARREMKALVSKMLRENISALNRSHAGECGNVANLDLSKESLYKACSTCLESLAGLFKQAARVSHAEFVSNQSSEDRSAIAAQIAHQCDNLQWLLEILIDRNMAGDFVKLWVNEVELSSIHKQISTMLRFEVSRLTARLCVAIGKGQVLCPVDVRNMLLRTWLNPLMDDFGWIQRSSSSSSTNSSFKSSQLDKNVVEDGISQTILTLPLKQQQDILLAWFDRFSNNGDNCPNLQRAFEVWWRRTFVRPCLADVA